jgi:hypothetical protein
VECDARAAPGLVVHLRRYRLRAHVDITPPAQRPAADEWAVGAVLTRGHVQSSSSSSSGGGSGEATPSPRDSLLQCLRSHAPSLVRARLTASLSSLWRSFLFFALSSAARGGCFGGGATWS